MLPEIVTGGNWLTDALDGARQTALQFLLPPVPLERGCWDGRWQIEGRPPEGEGLTLGALGDELAGFPEWRALGMAREALVTTPAIRSGGTVVAAPVVRPVAGFGVRRVSALALPWDAGILR